MNTNIQYFWEPNRIHECDKIPEKFASMEQTRISCGLEIDVISGTRYYFVPRC